MPEARPVNQIQAEIMTASEEIQAAFKKAGLVRLMTELERTYPEAMDRERVGEGEICPPLPWEIHADVGNAKILLEDVIQSLERASRLTEREVRQEWLERKLAEIGNASTKALLGFFVGLYVDSDFILDVRHGLARALLKLSDGMRDLEDSPEGREVLSQITDNMEGIQAHLVAIERIMASITERQEKHP